MDATEASDNLEQTGLCLERISLPRKATDWVGLLISSTKEFSSRKEELDRWAGVGWWGGVGSAVSDPADPAVPAPPENLLPSHLSLEAPRATSPIVACPGGVICWETLLCNHCQGWSAGSMMPDKTGNTSLELFH